MRVYKQSLDQCVTKLVCKVLLSILITASVYAVAAAPTSAQKREFEQYITPMYQATGHRPSQGAWKNFHQNNSYIRTGILGYTVPKKVVENGGSFVAHGIASYQLAGQLVRQVIIYRFNGDGSYWVVVGAITPSFPSRILSLAEYVAAQASDASGFVLETVGENAIRKWETEQRGSQILWETVSKPSLQEALDAYNNRVFFTPPGDPVDIEAGDPSLKSITLAMDDGIEINTIELLDLDVQTALRRTMNLNKLIQLRRDPVVDSVPSGILKRVRKELFSMEPVEVNATYGLLVDGLPRGGDYDFAPGCAG